MAALSFYETKNLWAEHQKSTHSHSLKPDQPQSKQHTAF